MHVVATLGTAVAMVVISSNAGAACRPPAYKLGSVLEDTPSRSLLNIVVRPDALSRESLVCLAQTLKRAYRGRPLIDILIFDSDRAAFSYTGDLPLGDYPPGKSDPRMRFPPMIRALYRYDRAKREEYVLLKPEGYSSQADFDTRIDLPVRQLPPCRLAFHGRCLLVLPPLAYPPELAPPPLGEAERLTGRVTLRGVLTAEGTVTNVEVVDTAGFRTPREATLSQAAAAHVGAWRLERAGRSEVVTITYVFDTSMSGRPWFEVTAPDRVLITELSAP